MSSELSRAGQRPGFDRERPSALRFVANEWGLLLLAAALAVMLYALARQDVMSVQALDRATPIRAQIDKTTGGADLLPLLHADQNTVSLVLDCSRMKREDIEERLLERGHIDLIVSGGPTDTPARALVAGRDRFDFPFATAHLAADRRPRVEGRGYVYRVEPRTLEVTLPTGTLPGFDVRFAWAPGAAPTFEARIPPTYVTGPIVPDPIDLEAFGTREHAGKPHEVALSFRRWIQQAAGNDPARQLFFEHLALPELRVEITVTATAARAIQNRVVYLLPRSLLEQFRFKPSTSIVFPNNGDELISRLRGTPAALDAAAAHAKDALPGERTWFWAVRFIGDFSKIAEDPEVEARIEWWTTDPRWRALGLAHDPSDEERSFFIEVTKRP